MRASEHRSLCSALEGLKAPAVAGVSSSWGCSLGRIARIADQARRAISVIDARGNVALDRRQNGRGRGRGRSRRQYSADDAILGVNSRTAAAPRRLDVRSRGGAHALRLFPRIHHGRDGRKEQLEDGREKPAKAEVASVNVHCG